MTQQFTPGPRTPAWSELTSHAARLSSVPVRELFARDPGRYERFSREKVGLLMDFSRQRCDEIVLNKLIELVDTVGLRERIDAAGSDRSGGSATGPAVDGSGFGIEDKRSSAKAGASVENDSCRVGGTGLTGGRLNGHHQSQCLSGAGVKSA